MIIYSGNGRNQYSHFAVIGASFWLIIDKFNINGGVIEMQKNKVKISNFILNEDGRCDEPILSKENFILGKYELLFLCGSYFKEFTNLDEPFFLDDVIIRFGINKEEHYHVPLLITPWSYSTYRGS